MLVLVFEQGDTFAMAQLAVNLAGLAEGGPGTVWAVFAGHAQIRVIPYVSRDQGVGARADPFLRELDLRIVE